MITKRAGADNIVLTAEQAARFFALSPDMFCVFDASGIVRGVNAAVTRIFGYDPDEVVGRPICEFLHPDDRPAALEQLALRSSGHELAGFECRGQAKDGSFRWLECSCTAPQAPEGLALAVCRDVTEQRVRDQRRREMDEEILAPSGAAHPHATADLLPADAPSPPIATAGDSNDSTALLRSQREATRLKGRLELLLDSIDEGICELDLAGRVAFINPAGARMLDWPARDLAGRMYHEVFRPTPTPGTEHARECPIRTTLTTGVHCSSQQAMFQRRDDVRFPVEFSCTALREDERLVGAVVTFRDTTEHVRRLAAEHELATARALQQLLYPKSPPQLFGFELAGAAFPAAMACGDYFDFMPLAEGRVAFAVGDVCGHGLASALYMIQTRAYLRSILKSDVDEVVVLRRLNTLLTHNKTDDMFLTLFFGTLDPQQRTVRYVGAGHDARLLRADGDVEELPSTGVVLGVFDELQATVSDPITLEPGDILLVVTDGLTETYSPARKMFGWERTLSLVDQHRTHPAAAIIDALRTAADDFKQTGPQLDDVTIMVIKAT